jgi:hypothetical protein
MWQIVLSIAPGPENGQALKTNPDHTQVVYENESFALSEHDYFRLVVACRAILGMWAEGLTHEEAKEIAITTVGLSQFVDAERETDEEEPG